MKVKEIFYNQILQNDEDIAILKNLLDLVAGHLKKQPRVHFRAILEELEDIETLTPSSFTNGPG